MRLYHFWKSQIPPFFSLTGGLKRSNIMSIETKDAQTLESKNRYNPLVYAFHNPLVIAVDFAKTGVISTEEFTNLLGFGSERVYNTHTCHEE